jgi:hypothetical protein
LTDAFGCFYLDPGEVGRILFSLLNPKRFFVGIESVLHPTGRGYPEKICLADLKKNARYET